MATARSGSLGRWRRNALRRMAASREATLAFVARLPEREILRPRTQDEWSVKDVLGHLLSCDEETVRRLKLIARGQADRIQWFESLAHADRFNARTVAQTRRLALRPMLRKMARVRADLIARFERLPEQALSDPSHAYPMTEWLPAPGWSHERDHLSDVRHWWTSLRIRPDGASPSASPTHPSALRPSPRGSSPKPSARTSRRSRSTAARARKSRTARA
jgi:hypothetical protein